MGAATQDPVREGRYPQSTTKPKMVILAAENLKCWTFPKSRVLPCRSSMLFFPPSSVTAASCRHRRSTQNLAMVQRHRLCREGIAAALGLVCHVFCPLGAVRGNDQPYGFSLQAPHHGKADPVPVYQHRHQLHEPGGSALE